MGAKIASLGSQERNLGPDSPESVRIASLRSLAAEAGLKIDPVTEADIEPSSRACSGGSSDWTTRDTERI